MSDRIKSLLLSQFAACHDCEGWFVPLHKALDGVTAEQATWKENESTNSIWEIVNHLTFWNDRYLKRFRDLPTSEEQTDNDATFAGPEDLANELDWLSTVVKLLATRSDWRISIRQCDETKLYSPVRRSSKDPWMDVIAHINIHNAYHLGQIVQIRKTQGSWNPNKGC